MEVVDLEKEAMAEEQKKINDALTEAETILQSIKDLDYEKLKSKLSPLDRARYDLAILYSINSYYWMYLRSLGKDTKSHDIMTEMGRIKKITDRIKEMTEKTKKRSMVLDGKAAKRMVAHELWQPSAQPLNKRIKFDDAEENWDNPEPGCSKDASKE